MGRSSLTFPPRYLVRVVAFRFDIVKQEISLLVCIHHSQVYLQEIWVYYACERARAGRLYYLKTYHSPLTFGTVDTSTEKTKASVQDAKWYLGRL